MATNFDTTARDEYLQQFPNNWRSQFANTFLEAVRAGANTPSLVLIHVTNKCQERLGYGWYGDGEKFGTLLNTLETQAALDYAAWCIHYESLPQGDRNRMKAAQRDKHLQAHMQALPPTEPQLALLRRLKWTGEPEVANKAEASALIEAYLNQRKAS